MYHIIIMKVIFMNIRLIFMNISPARCFVFNPTTSLLASYDYLNRIIRSSFDSPSRYLW